MRRVLAGTGANAYAQGVTLAIQLLSLPLFLARWDLATYGQWLVLSAVPAYLAMADAGLVTAAGNRLTMLCADGRDDAAEVLFQSTLAALLAVCGAALAVALLAGLLWPAAAPLRLAGVLLAATVLATLLGGLPEAVYRATQRYALGTALAASLRLAEWAGGLAGLWLHGSLVAVAAGGLAVRALGTLALVAHAAASTPRLRWSLARARAAALRGCLGPAAGFMAFPIANALTYQGMTLVCAATLGPAATVVFNSLRTLARVTVQATGTFSHALWPEFARLYGRGDAAALAALHRRAWRLGALVALGVAAAVGLAAPALLRWWSRGHIDAVPGPVLLLAVAYAALASAWHVPRVLLLSTNRHAALAAPALAVAALTLPAAWLGAAAAPGVAALLAVMAAGELLLLVLCAWLASRLLAPSPLRPRSPP